jgi:hypothetical protein
MIMAGFKVPDFSERAAAARQAKQAALDKLRAKPAPDEATLAAQREAREAREAAEAERRAAKRAAEQEAKAAARAEAERIAAEKAVPARPALTEAELKAARDARYAARKGRAK